MPALHVSPPARLVFAGVGAATAYLLPSVALVSAPARRALGVRATVDDPHSVALTFDDGPHSEGTPRVLSVLERAGARATFFLAGEQVERRPSLAAEIVAAGHEAGVHCRRHRNLMRLTPLQVRDDLERAAAVIGEATGYEPRRYRPPYGILTTPALAVARRRNWDVVLWTRDGEDWDARATPETIRRRLLARVRGGDVLLLHDADYYSAPGSWRRTADALQPILEELAARGLATAPLG